MDSFLQDLLCCGRRILRSPLSTASILLSLSLGIGVNASVFIVANAVLLAPLPYPAADRLVILVEGRAGTATPDSPISPPNFVDIKTNARSFAPLAAWAGARSVLQVAGTTPETLPGAAVSADFFPALGTPFALGRGFTTSEDRSAAAHVAVISTALWRRRFGAAPSIIGSKVILDEQPCIIVGVIDSRWAYPAGSEFWVPLALRASDSPRSARWLSTIARLRPGVSGASAQAELALLARQLARLYPAADSKLYLTLLPLREVSAGRLRSALILLTAVAALVLLVACANVASMFLARSLTHAREFAVRSALGASTWRMLRLALCEGNMLALAAGGAGIILSSLSISALVSVGGDSIPSKTDLGIGWSVVLVTIGISLLTGTLLTLAFGFRRSSAQCPAVILRTSDHSPGSRSLSILRGLSVVTVAEVSLTVVALLAAALLTRSFLALINTSPGFDVSHVLVADLSLPEQRYQRPAKMVLLYDRLLAQMAVAPGVEHAGVIFPLPLGNDEFGARIAVDGGPPDGASVSVSVSAISPDLLAAMGIPVISGRGLTDRDTADAPAVAVISSSLARLLWPQQSALGKRVVINPTEPRHPWVTIVGVVGDIDQRSLREDLHFQLYRPIKQAPRPMVTLLLRGRTVTVDLLREELRQVDPGLALDDVRMFRQVVTRSVQRERFQSLLTTFFAVLALCLSTAGVFGVVSYGIRQRTHEIGVRMALGATRQDIRRLVLLHGLRPVVLGLILGIVLFVPASAALATFLFGLGRHDLRALLAVFLLVLGVSTAAILVPLRRATAVDPAAAFRCD